MNVAWIFENEEYVRHFSHYLASRQDLGIRVRFFTSVEAFARFPHAHRFDWIAVDEQWSSHPALPLTQRMLVLCDRKGGEAIDPYQPIPNLLRQLRERASNESTDVSNSHEPSVLSVYSASGGAGKTITAMTLAAILSKQGKRVLYAPLEMSGSGPNSEADGMSELLLYLRDSELRVCEDRAKWIQSSAFGYDELAPFRHPLDAVSMTAGDVERLLATYRKAYDSIVLDLDSELSERTMAALRASSEILWIVPQGRMHVHKLERLLARIKEPWTEIAKFLVNKSIGPVRKSEFQHLNVQGYMPYIASWKQCNDYSDMLREGNFRSAMEAALSASPYERREAAG